MRGRQFFWLQQKWIPQNKSYLMMRKEAFSRIPWIFLPTKESIFSCLMKSSIPLPLRLPTPLGRETKLDLLEVFESFSVDCQNFQLLKMASSFLITGRNLVSSENYLSIRVSLLFSFQLKACKRKVVEWMREKLKKYF